MAIGQLQMKKLTKTSQNEIKVKGQGEKKCILILWTLFYEATQSKYFILFKHIFHIKLNEVERPPIVRKQLVF